MRHQNPATGPYAIHLNVIFLHVLMVLAAITDSRLMRIVAGMFAVEGLHFGARSIVPRLGADGGDVAAEGTECVLQERPQAGDVGGDNADVLLGISGRELRLAIIVWKSRSKRLTSKSRYLRQFPLGLSKSIRHVEELPSLTHIRKQRCQDPLMLQEISFPSTVD
jgi:hypothetical protein